MEPAGDEVARRGALQADGLRAVADLRELDWATSRSLHFSFGSVGPRGTTHSAAFAWSQPQPGIAVSDKRSFRMPAGVPITDAAGMRAQTWGGPHEPRARAQTWGGPHEARTSRTDPPSLSVADYVAGGAGSGGAALRLPQVGGWSLYGRARCSYKGGSASPASTDRSRP